MLWKRSVTLLIILHLTEASDSTTASSTAAERTATAKTTAIANTQHILQTSNRHGKMPNWDGIEDVRETPLKVWLSRKKENDPWVPLRKVDCYALNEAEEESTTVLIDGGRATANKKEGTITSNFHRGPVRELRSAVWFIRKDPNNTQDKEQNLEPLWNKEDTEKIESLYQKAIEASSSFGKGIDSVLSQNVELEDGSKVLVVKAGGGNTLCMKKRPSGWLASSQDLQRGYGGYKVEGEENELMLGPIKHLMFVVHGIGESMWSREDTSVFGLIEEVNRLRLAVQKRQVEEWKKACEKAKKAGDPMPHMPDRIEFIPIEWYDTIHDSSSSLSKSLQAITLPTIPALRGIANEAVFDVLMYITPNFCESVLNAVTTQITTAYEKFLEVHPDFTKDEGKVHLTGHSLGSMIVWDLLTILKDFQEPVPKQKLAVESDKKETSGSGVKIMSKDDNMNNNQIGYQTYAEQENADTAQNGSWGPTLPKRLTQTLPFLPENVLFLGSPIGMFLTLRGSHPVFDELRTKKAEEITQEWTSNKDKTENTEDVSNQLPFASPFTLPVEGSVYNIFHPSDPVAYRIEPLLLPPDMDAKDIPAPPHLTAQGQGVRLHVKAQQIGDEILRAMEGKRASFSGLFSQAVTVLGKSIEEGAGTQQSRGRAAHSTAPEIFPLGGKSQRVDYQLQRGVVDNEYLSAVTAHSNYFTNSDVIDFVADLGSKKATETFAVAEAAKKKRNSSSGIGSMGLITLLQLCLLSIFTVSTEAFTTTRILRFQQVKHRQEIPLYLAASPQPETEDDDEWNLTTPASLDKPVGPEKSRMVNYISDFLKKGTKEEQDDSAAGTSDGCNTRSQDFTHLIAIPMGDNQELAIELESVQRAILYHCPVLVHACVVPAKTRLPLLYVRAPSQQGLSTQEATNKLHQIVEEVVQRNINVKPEINSDTVRVDDNGVVEEEPIDGINKNGIRPLALTFQSLECDGPNNQVLSTVALPDDPGTRRLQHFVYELQRAITTQLPSWEVSLPPDDNIESNNEKSVDGSNNNTVFRPRLPFMRIPSNFEDYLDPLPDDRDDEMMRTSDEGGNGISPIFWASWWDDVFGTTRLREIGIYPQTLSFPFSKKTGLGEDAFHIPMQLTRLPEGNDSLTKQEAKFEDYQDQRMRQAEYDFQQDRAKEKGLKDSRGSVEGLPDDPMLSKTRARLESLYQDVSPDMASDNCDGDFDDFDDELSDMFGKRPYVDTTLLDDWTQERIKKANAARGNTVYDDEADEGDVRFDGIRDEVQEPITDNANTSDPDIFSTFTESSNENSSDLGDDPDQLDDLTQERIRKAIASRGVVKSKAQLAVKKDKVPIQDNSVFQKFKDGTLIPNSKKREATTARELEPFPSREQFVGFWQVMSSPTGFPPDDDGGDGSKSENLVFRVDGTTAGGPVLDPETKQKACGGTWKVTPNKDGDDKSADVRIRLVIPPNKDRILVMEGTACKRSLIPLKDLPPMASSTFGIPELEEKAKQAEKGDNDFFEEEKIYCTGKVWLEDASTTKNKFDIGEFSLVKLNTPRDPSQYTITIPRPIRNQD